MWVRIARFEGAEGNWDERIEEIRNRMQGAGDAVDSPMEAIRGTVSRAMMLVDRAGGRGAGLIFCDSEEDLRRVDEAMNQMNPPPGGGTRASVEMYEVAVDEQPS
jgi:hypothetical protein